MGFAHGPFGAMVASLPKSVIIPALHLGVNAIGCRPGLSGKVNRVSNINANIFYSLVNCSPVIEM